MTDYIHLIKFKEGGRRGGVSEYLLTSFSLNSFLPNTFKLFQPRKNKSSRAVADLLFSKNFLNYGFPKLVINDQGREFVIKLFQCTEKLAERKSLKTTHYHLMDKVISDKNLDGNQKLNWKDHNKKKSFQCFYIPVILFDSVYGKDGNYYPKVLWEKFIHNVFERSIIKFGFRVFGSSF